MLKWFQLAWANRARITAVARKLGLSLRTWVTLLALAVIVVGLYLAMYVLTVPQYIMLVVTLLCFAVLLTAEHRRWNHLDEVWDEVDQLRGQVDSLRAALYEHEHDVVDAGDGSAAILPVVDRIATEELPQVGLVQRELGGRAFSFRE